MIITCPKCFSSDDVTYESLPDDVLQYRCGRSHDGSGPHTWLRAKSELAAAIDESPEGVTDELLEPFSQCVVAGEPLTEYGVIEYRFSLAYPELFAAHVAERGHVMLKRKVATASGVRFAMALSRLAERGELVREYGQATGAWSYDGQVSYWAKPPVTSPGRVTWVEYCTREGRSPEWTEDDVRRATGT